MALKPDRIELQTDISFFMSTTGTRGGVASLSSAGSGVAMDDASAVVAYTSNPKQTIKILKRILQKDQALIKLAKSLTRKN